MCNKMLSLGRCIKHVLKQWKSLLIYHKEKNLRATFQPRIVAYTISKLPGRQTYTILKKM